jgi:hypothetical protein
MSQKFVFSYTQLYAPVRSYTQLYSAIRSCTQQLFSYTPAQSENRVNARFQAENYIREKRKTVPSCSSHGRQWSSVVASGRQNAISGRQKSASGRQKHASGRQRSSSFLPRIAL